MSEQPPDSAYEPQSQVRSYGIELDRAVLFTFGELDPKCGPVPAVLALLKALSRAIPCSAVGSGADFTALSKAVLPTNKLSVPSPYNRHKQDKSASESRGINVWQLLSTPTQSLHDMMRHTLWTTLSQVGNSRCRNSSVTCLSRHDSQCRADCRADSHEWQRVCL